MALYPTLGGASFLPHSVKVVRLILKGCASRPFFHISIMEGFRDQKEPVIEQLGSYDPLPNKYNEKLVAINFVRLEHWLEQGAILSKPVNQLLGLCGYFPIHHTTFQNAWENRLKIKKHLENLRTQVANIEKSATVTEVTQSSDT